MSWTSIRPLGGRVVVKLDARRDRLGSIIIPDEHQRQPESATVIAVGRLAPQEIQPGMKVSIGKYNGTPIPAPEHDPTGEYYVLDCDYSKRGQKLPVTVMGYTHAPYLPDLFGVIEAEEGEDVTQMVSSDMPRKRRR